MNAPIDTIATAHPASFPIAYPSQMANNDLDDALSMLRVVSELMGDDRGVNAEFAHDLNIVIASAMDRLGPVLIHIRELDRQDHSGRYAQARREWVRERGGRS